MVNFDAYTDYYGGDWKMTALGLGGDKKLESNGSAVTIGASNRAWILDYPNDESIYWSYWHDYHGGTFEFDVNLADIGCTQAAGMYLVQADDEQCSWKAKEDGTEPQCSRVELMEANIYGFKVAGFPCEFDSCTAGAQTKFADAAAYGPGSSYTIDSLQPFKVNTKFIAFDNSGEPGELMRIETCLI